MRWPPPFPATSPPRVAGAAAHSCGAAVADWSRYCTGSERIGQTAQEYLQPAWLHACMTGLCSKSLGRLTAWDLRIHCETVETDIQVDCTDRSPSALGLCCAQANTAQRPIFKRMRTWDHEDSEFHDCFVNVWALYLMELWIAMFIAVITVL
jgi:hypothetical protein